MDEIQEINPTLVLNQSKVQFYFRVLTRAHADGENKIRTVKALVALVLDMSRTCPGLVLTFPVLGQCPVFMGTQDRLQNVSHGLVTCPFLSGNSTLPVADQKKGS